MADRVGQQCGDYRLIRSLGKGAFGDVYLGEHTRSHTQAAVKILKMQLTNPRDLRNFLNEARTFRLQHPHIVQLLDFGAEEDGTAFLIIDYAPHGTLRSRHPQGSRLPLDTVVEYIEQIAPALQYAHDQGLVHRDIKPENMLLGRNNQVLLSDFGIAAVAHSLDSAIPQGRSGTPYYMAPEQMRGKPVRSSDQYALGIVVYEWLSGTPPFNGDQMQLMYQHLEVLPPPFAKDLQIPPPVEQVVQKALAKDPRQRFASVQEFANALKQAGNPKPPPPTEELPVRLIPGSLGSIQFLSGPLAGSTFPINKMTITIGRDPVGNDIVIPDPTISRHHARLAYDGSQWSVEKLNPQNTLTINNREVQQAVIHDRDTIGLGPGTSFLFVSNAGAQRPAPLAPSPQNPQGVPYSPPPANLPFNSPPAQQSFSAPPPPPPPADYHTMVAPSPMQMENAPTQRVAFDDSAGGIPSLEISSNINPHKQVYSLAKQVISIGRDPSNDIIINEPVVSAFHAQIVRDGTQLILVHPHPKRQNTANGLLYQGHQIPGNEQFHKPLARGDIFRIGDEHGTLVTLTYNDGSSTSQEFVPEIRPIPLGAPIITIGWASDNDVVLNHPQVSDHHARLEQVQGGYRIVDLGSTNHVYVNGKQVSSHLLTPSDVMRIGPFKITYTGTQLTQHYEERSIRIDALHLKKVGNKQTILLNDISLAIPPRKFVALLGGAGSGKTSLLDALSGVRPAQQGTVLYNGQDYYHHLAAFSTQIGYVPQDALIHGDLTVERTLYYGAKLRLPADLTEIQVKQRIDEVLQDVEMESRRKVLVNKLPDWQRKQVSVALELLSNPSVFFLDEPTSGLDPDLDRKMTLLLRKLADKGHTIVLVTRATNNINACDYVCFLAQGGRLAYYGPPEEAKAYFGKTDFAEIYSALKPTEQNPNIPAQAEERFKSSPDFQKYVVAPLNQGPAGRANPQQQASVVKWPRRGNSWKQFFILSMRSLELLKNDRSNLLILLLQAPVVALILLFLAGTGTFDATSVANCPTQVVNGVPPAFTNFRGHCDGLVRVLDMFPNAPGVTQQGGPDATLNQAIASGSGGEAQKILFIMVLAAVLFGCVNGFREISKEVAIYRRERAVNLGIAPYLLSKVVVLGVLCLLQSAVLVLLVNLRAPLQRGVFLYLVLQQGITQNGQPGFVMLHGVFLNPVLEVYITLVLTSLVGLMIGLMTSTIVSNSARLLSLISILGAQVLFAGIIFPLDTPLLKFIGMFFVADWAMAGMGTSIGLHSDKLGQDDCSYTQPPPSQPANFYSPGANPGNCPYQGNLFVSVTHQAADTVTAELHLLLVWFALIVLCVVLGVLTAYLLKRKDIW